MSADFWIGIQCVGMSGNLIRGCDYGLMQHLVHRRVPVHVAIVDAIIDEVILLWTFEIVAQCSTELWR